MSARKSHDQISQGPEADSPDTGLPIVTAGARRVLDYVVQCLAHFNRGAEEVELAAVGQAISKAADIARLLDRDFGVAVRDIRLTDASQGRGAASLAVFRLTFPDGRPSPANEPLFLDQPKPSLPFPIYHLIFDRLLHATGGLTIACDGRELLRVSPRLDGFQCTAARDLEKILADSKTGEARAEQRKTLEVLHAALYRSGLLLSPRWSEVADKLSESDDVILGLDTNLLLDCVVSQQLLDGLIYRSCADYCHTPNWLLLVVTSTVMHEIEQAANSRDDRGQLSRIGRLGYRAIQEILELDQSKDLRGVSLLIVGDSNPDLDTRIELRGLREDFKKAAPPELQAHLYRKMSSGDTLIRDQFKAFLRQISFHKGAFFVTGDKSNSALARAEGLQSIYYPPAPPSSFNRSGRKLFMPRVPCGDRSLPITLPLGKLLYELAIDYDNLVVSWPDGLVRLTCDTRGDSLERWLGRELEIFKKDWKKLLAEYQEAARIDLASVHAMSERLDRQLGDWG